MGRHVPATPALAGSRRRRRADLTGADIGHRPGHPRRPGRALRRRLRGAGGTGRAHRHTGRDHPERQERLPRGPPALARHGRAHAAGDGGQRPSSAPTSSLGIGTSFTRSLYIAPMPAQATLGQIVETRATSPPATRSSSAAWATCGSCCAS